MKGDYITWQGDDGNCISQGKTVFHCEHVSVEHICFQSVHMSHMCVNSLEMPTRKCLSLLDEVKLEDDVDKEIRKKVVALKYSVAANSVSII